MTISTELIKKSDKSLGEIADMLHNYLIVNRNRFKLKNRDVMKVSSRVIRTELGLHPQAIYYALLHLQYMGLIELVEKRNSYCRTVYVVRLNSER